MDIPSSYFIAWRRVQVNRIKVLRLAIQIVFGGPGVGLIYLCPNLNAWEGVRSLDMF